MECTIATNVDMVSDSEVSLNLLSILLLLIKQLKQLKQSVTSHISHRNTSHIQQRHTSVTCAEKFFVGKRVTLPILEVAVTHTDANVDKRLLVNLPSQTMQLMLERVLLL